MRIRFLSVAFAATTMLTALPALAAGEGERLARAFFEAETTDMRAKALAAMQAAAPSDNSVRFALGSAQFFAAVEGLSQDLSRHGFTPPGGRRQWSMLPLDWPENVEKLDYDGFRGLLDRFHTRLETAAATLATVAPDDPVGIVISFETARFDVSGKGPIAPQGSFLAILAGMGGGVPPVATDAAPPVEFRFDNADAIWLQGYANVLMGQTDFLLAHDLRRSFDTTMHSIFPRAGLPLAAELAPKEDEFRDFWDGRLADAISFIHLLDWTVEDPARRARVRERMLEVVRLSRANWAAIRAETDNDREWLPGPQQPGIHPVAGREVTEEMVAGWMVTLTLAEDILEGRALVPHWRFPGRGVNVRKLLQDDANFDLVLLLTGPAALPYLESGKVVSREDMRSIEQLIGPGNFLSTAAWFN